MLSLESNNICPWRHIPLRIREVSETPAMQAGSVPWNPEADFAWLRHLARVPGFTRKSALYLWSFADDLGQSKGCLKPQVCHGDTPMAIPSKSKIGGFSPKHE